MKKPLVCLVFVALSAGTRGSAAEPPPCAPSSALAGVACELARQLGPQPGALAVATAPASDAKPNGLERRLTYVVAGAMGATAATTALGLAHARTLAARAGKLVHLEVQIEGGELRVTADVYEVPNRFWDRVKNPRPAPLAHAYASRRLDAEVQTFLPAVPLVALHVDRASSPERDVAALACDDVDADGSLELVVAARRRIHVGRLRGGKFAAHASREWAVLSAVSPRPLREPIAAIAIASGAHVDVGISDRANGVRLAPDLSKFELLEAQIPRAAGGCSKIHALAIDTARVACRAGDAAAPVPAPASAADAIAGARVPDAAGELRTIEALRVMNRDEVVVADDRGRRATIALAGAQIAVGDIDRDGAPDIVVGSSTLDPAADAVVVYTWQNDGAIIERTRIAVQAGVRALAVCPPMDGGSAAIAVATANEIWIVR